MIDLDGILARSLTQIATQADCIALLNHIKELEASNYLRRPVHHP